MSVVFKASVCVGVCVCKSVCVKGCLYSDQKGAAHDPAMRVCRGCAYSEVISGIVQSKAAESDSRDCMGCVWKNHTYILLILQYVLFWYCVQMICISKIC